MKKQVVKGAGVARAIGYGVGATLAVLAASSALAQATYTNPVLNENFADPSVMKVGRILYAYATGKDDNNPSNPTPFIKMSKTTSVNSLTSWSPHKGVMALPSWADPVVPEVWAPHVFKNPNAAQYIMYFTAQGKQGLANFPNPGACLGVATATSPDGPFTAAAQPLQCGSGEKSIRDIDPFVFFNAPENKWFLYYGSANDSPEFGEGGIKMRALAPNFLGFASGSTEFKVFQLDKANPIVNNEADGKYQNLVEGSWVIDRGDYRYLFMSGSGCCKTPPDIYAVTVARRDLRIAGSPFENYPGPDHTILKYRPGVWENPGHNAVFQDGAGEYWIMYHSRKGVGQEGDPRNLMIDKITWSNGWPRIANDMPSYQARPAPTPFP